MTSAPVAEPGFLRLLRERFGHGIPQVRARLAGRSRTAGGREPGHLHASGQPCERDDGGAMSRLSELCRAAREAGDGRLLIEQIPYAHFLLDERE